MYAVARSRMRDGKGLQLSTTTICDLGVVHIQFGLRIDGLQSVDYYRILLSSTMSLTRMCQACRNFEIVEGRNVLTLKEMMNLVYELFECFVARHDSEPIVQRLHAFDPAAIWSWDLGFVCMDGSCLLRVSPVFDTGYECICDLDFVENRIGAPHSDPSDDLRIKGREIECFLAS
jgi:hypothetical protein